MKRSRVRSGDHKNDCRHAAIAATLISNRPDALEADTIATNRVEICEIPACFDRHIFGKLMRRCRDFPTPLIVTPTARRQTCACSP
jgi:hypothetical protein